MKKWYDGITEQEFTNAINDAVIKALKDGVNAKTADYKDYVRAHLKMWKESGIPAPGNELQSIQGWLHFIGSHTKEETLDTMRLRMAHLMKEANLLHAEGSEAEDAVGIYENRPDLKEKK